MFGGKKKNKDNAPTSFSTSVNNTMTTKIAVPKDAKAKSSSTTLIAKDTKIVGDIQFVGNLEVEGCVVGNITSLKNDTEASLRLLESGSIKGDIQIGRASINGEVEGNVRASNVELAAKAKVQGNVHYQTLEMTKGAQVNGSLLFEQEVHQAIVIDDSKKQKEQQTQTENSKKEQ